MQAKAESAHWERIEERAKIEALRPNQRVRNWRQIQTLWKNAVNVMNAIWHLVFYAQVVRRVAPGQQAQERHEFENHQWRNWPPGGQY